MTHISPESKRGLFEIRHALSRLRDLECAPVIPARLVRRPVPQDANAIEVWVKAAGLIGWLPRDMAAVYAPLLDSGGLITAWIEEIPVHPDYPDNPGVQAVIELETKGPGGSRDD